MPTLSNRRLTPTDRAAQPRTKVGWFCRCQWLLPLALLLLPPQIRSDHEGFVHAFARLSSTGSTNNHPFTRWLKSQTKAASPRPVTACHESWDEPPLLSRAFSYPAGFPFPVLLWPGALCCLRDAREAGRGGRVRPASSLSSVATRRDATRTP
jgi:hypothetical protein